MELARDWLATNEKPNDSTDQKWDSSVQERAHYSH